MIVERHETMPVKTPDDVVRARRAVRTLALDVGFSLVDQTKIVTAASEIARNTLDYGNGGTLDVEVVRHGVRRGLRLVFADKGPGIPDIERALTEGYSSGKGLGLGLGGAKRLCSEFDIKSAPGQGTIVTLVRWK